MSTSGDIRSLNGTEYLTVREWCKNEFITHLPDSTDKAKVIVRCLRDFFTQPGRGGNSIVQYIHNLESTETHDEQGSFFSTLNENSHLSVEELFVYA